MAIRFAFIFALLAHSALGGISSSLINSGGGALQLPQNGGTGVSNNAAATLTRSGNHALTITTTNTTNVTLPTSGTLAVAGANGDITSLTAVTAMTRTGGVAITGTNTNDAASAGQVGQVITSTVVTGSALSLSTGTAADLTSISLTAGDWDVSAAVAFNTAATTTLTQLTAGANTTSATLPASPGYPDTGTMRSQHNFASFTPGTTAHSVVLPTYRVSLSATTTYYLVVRGTFGTSTLTAQGYIQARRLR